jgi:hypothetical protein
MLWPMHALPCCRRKLVSAEFLLVVNLTISCGDTSVGSVGFLGFRLAESLIHYQASYL